MRSFFLLFLASQIFYIAHSQGAAKDPKDPKAPANAAPGNQDAPGATASYLSFNPPLMAIGKGAKEGSPVAVKLKERPSGSVAVYLEAPNLIFSKCKLNFNSRNWDKDQMVMVTPVPYLTQADGNRNIKAKFCCSSRGDKALHGKCQEYPVTREKGSGSVCTAYGDPHYTSFSGRLFDFQGKGSYYFVKSDDFSVQQMNIPWMAGAATVQTKVAVRYHDSVYVFDGATKKAQLAAGTGEGIQMVEAPGVNAKLSLSDGSAVEITYNGTPQSHHVGTKVTLGQDYGGAVSGLCGDFGKQQFVTATGQTVTDPNQYGASWAVPADDDIFQLGAQATSIKAVKAKKIEKKNTCKIPNLEEEEDDDENDGTYNVDQGERYVKKVEKYNTREAKKLLTKLKEEKSTYSVKNEPTKFWKETAKQKCTALIHSEKLKKLVDPAKYIQECIDDCVLSGSYDLIESSKRAYLSAVNDYVKSTKAEPIYQGAAAQSIKAVVTEACDSAGLGNNDCPKKCSGNGKCIYSGCACNPGYTGIDCSRKISRPPPKEKCYTDKKMKTQSLDIKIVSKAPICNRVKDAYRKKHAYED